MLAVLDHTCGSTNVGHDPWRSVAPGGGVTRGPDLWGTNKSCDCSSKSSTHTDWPAQCLAGGICSCPVMRFSALDGLMCWRGTRWQGSAADGKLKRRKRIGVGGKPGAGTALSQGELTAAPVSVSSSGDVVSSTPCWHRWGGGERKAPTKENTSEPPTFFHCC